MYRCILVPVDGTPFGEQAIPYAVAIARRCGAVLHLAHVHLPPIIPSGAETAALPPVWIEMSLSDKSRYLERLAATVMDAEPVRVETRVIDGLVTTALERLAIRCGAGLVVMSTHGHSGLSRLWHHGVAEHLARDLPVPVLLIRRDNGSDEVPQISGYSNILVPLDGSAEAELIIEHAATLARALSARITLARVSGPALPDGADGSELPEARDGAELLQQRTAARQYLNGLAERLRSRGLDVATEVLHGEEEARAILAHIAAVDEDPGRRVDIVAYEAPHRGAVSRLLVHETVDDVVRFSPVPVLLSERRVPRADGTAARVGAQSDSPRV